MAPPKTYVVVNVWTSYYTSQPPPSQPIASSGDS